MRRFGLQVLYALYGARLRQRRSAKIWPGRRVLRVQVVVSGPLLSCPLCMLLSSLTTIPPDPPAAITWRLLPCTTPTPPRFGPRYLPAMPSFLSSIVCLCRVTCQAWMVFICRSGQMLRRCLSPSVVPTTRPHSRCFPITTLASHLVTTLKFCAHCTALRRCQPIFFPWIKRCRE